MPPATGSGETRGAILRGKGKAPNTSGEVGVARSRARRAPTNANKLDQVIERVTESRVAQEAIRLELVTKLESLQRDVADVAAFTQPTETPSPLGKRKAETSPDVLEQLRREAEILQPVPQRRFKVAVSKRATYPDPEDRGPVKEIPPREEGPKEPPLAPESFGEISSTIPNSPPPIPKKTIPTVNAEPSSPATPRAPPVEPTFVKVPPQQSSSGKPPKCPKCKFLHTGRCALQPNTYFRCMQPGHQAKDCLYEMVCNGCKERGHLARECPKRRKRD
ncbi:hypothetical protein ACLOJK_013275 [Asimina triloba]